jgi:hypothetical protein
MRERFYVERRGVVMYVKDRQKEFHGRTIAVLTDSKLADNICEVLNENPREYETER